MSGNMIYALLWLALGISFAIIIRLFQNKYLQKFNGKEKKRKQKELYTLCDCIFVLGVLAWFAWFASTFGLFASVFILPIAVFLLLFVVANALQQKG